MAAPQTVISIGSSPPAASPTRHGSFHSSSPAGELPSPSQLVRKNVAILKSGSKVMAPPLGVSMGFTSARNIHQEAQEEANDVEGEIRQASIRKEEEKTTTKPIKARGKLSKPRGKRTTAELSKERVDEEDLAADEPATQIAQQSKSSTAVYELLSSPHEGKSTGKRKRVPKTTCEAQSVPKSRKKAVRKKPDTTSDRGDAAEDIPEGEVAGKVTEATKSKPGRKKKAVANDAVGDVSKANDGLKNQSAVDQKTSRHFRSAKAASPSDHTPEQRPVEAPVLRDAVQTQTVLAPARRRSWTPIAPDLPPSNQQHSEPAEDNEEKTAPGQAFSHLIGAYAYQNGGDLVPKEPESLKKSAKKAPTRRKRVEAAEGVAPRQRKTAKSAGTPKAEKLKKEKAKKTPGPKVQKLRNVTDYALQAYRLPVEAEHETPKTYVQTSDGKQKVTAADPSYLLNPEPSNTRTSRAMANARAEVRFTDPEKLCEKMRNQDFVFGTSSQLAREESPTMIRHIQQAIEESEEAAWLSQAHSALDSPSKSYQKVAHAPHGTSLSIAPSESKLWTVSARDTDQKMFAGDERPGQQSVDKEDQALVQQVQDTTDMDDSHHDSGFGDISEVVHAAEAKVVTADPIKNEGADLNTSQIVGLPQPDEGLLARPILRSIDVNISPAKTSPLTKQKPAAPTEMERPSTLPARLDTSSAQAEAPNKRPRGRPRKDQIGARATTPSPVRKRQSPASKTTQSHVKLSVIRKARLTLSSSPFRDIDDIEEISDSEAHTITPSPPRRLASSPDVSPIPLQLSPKAAEITETATEVISAGHEDNEFSNLFSEISRTVKAQPRSQDLAYPTWWEKILMYDPIVLEDLTAWLHCQGIRMEVPKGESNEKTKKSKKGKGKIPAPTSALELVDAGGQKVDSRPETEKVDLKPAIVQKWCEHNSVCCLWKEGLRGGVRQRY